MTYEQFIEKVANELKEALGEEFTVELKDFLKNNDEVMKGVTLISKNSNIAPVVYLDNSWKSFQNAEKNIAEIVNDICILVKKEPAITFDPKNFEDFEKVKDTICFKLVNSKTNKKKLNEVPHFPYLDFEIIFYSRVAEDAIVNIENKHLEMWGVSPNQLLEAATKNTPELLPVNIKSMSDVMREMFKTKIDMGICSEEEVELYIKSMEAAGEPSMTILSNESYQYGAGAIAYPEVLENISKENNGGNLVIIPSSIHEVIVIPNANKDSFSKINNMIQSVNKNEVKPQDVLGRRAMYYDSKEKTLCQINNSGKLEEQKIEPSIEKLYQVRKRKTHSM